MKGLIVGSTFLVISFLVLFAGNAPFVLTSAPVGIVDSARGTATSTNWREYAVTGSSGSVTAAAGSWVVLAVSCPP